jgi:adenosylcobinamide-GDP ribazoletransferase
MSYKRRNPNGQISMSDSPYDPNEPIGATGAAAEWWADILTAAAFLTRLPIRVPGGRNLDSLARAARAFPIVGAGIGLVGGLMFALAMALGLHPLLAAFVTIAATSLLTGALHEDGLADVADGFGGGEDRDAKLRTMRDSRIGSFGVLALILTVILRGGALAALGTPTAVFFALIASHAVSRAFIVAIMNREPLARDDGLAATAGRPSSPGTGWAIGIGIGVALLALGLAAPVALGGGVAAAWGMARLARRQIGGYTGDVLGAAQQAVETVVLLAVVAQS